jgi:vacuolar protein sorting-associated protein 16
MNNPFDDSFEETKVTTNPFDDDAASSSAPTLNENESTFFLGGETNINDLQDAPAEASWQYLGDLPYRRIPIYRNVPWELACFPATALQNHRFADPRALLSKTTVTKCVGCPNGGPIAVMTLPLTATGNFPRTELRILTVSGQTLALLEFPPPILSDRYTPADVLDIGFTSRCILMVVLKDSLCLTYDLRGDTVLQPFSILESGSELQLAHVYDGGVAVLAKNKDAAIVELFDKHDDNNEYLAVANRIVRRFNSATTVKDGVAPYYALVTPLFPLAKAGFCAIAVLSRARTLNRHPEVFLSTGDNSVVVVNTVTGQSTDLNCRERIASPIVDMCFAPNGRFLACFTESSMLTVISSSFETKVLDFDTSEGSSSPPLEMKWCGEDSVVLHWKNLGVLMVGPYGDWLRFPYEGTDNLFLLPETDCCRVVTDHAVEILQRVPPATALLLRIGSIETSAMLLDASDAHHSGSPSSDEAALTIVKTGMLDDAIETCTDSATKEFDIPTQKRLLRAASYGLHFKYKADAGGEKSMLVGGPLNGSDSESTGLLPSYTTVKFVEAARKLRILNALRNPEVGFLITSAQFDAMTPAGVVARLIAMKRPTLAAEISKYMRLSKSTQLYARASRASAFVEQSSHLSDSETAEKAISIINGGVDEGDLLSLNRGGFALVALAATKAGRPGVANLLLMLESSVPDKVPALISSGAYADAIAVATTARYVPNWFVFLIFREHSHTSFPRDADFVFSSLVEYQRSCLLSVSPSEIAKAQATFLSTVVSKFTPEAFHTLRRYLQATGDIKSLSSLLLKAQRAADAGCAIATRALEQDDFREKQGMLSVRRALVHLFLLFT